MFNHSLVDEVWKPIENYPDYFVSNKGRITSTRRVIPYIMKGGRGTSSMRYFRVTLRGREGTKCVNIHTLVASAFLGKRPKGLLTLHWDGDVSNCSVDNLYYGTHQQNADDRITHGNSGKREKNPNSKLTDTTIEEIRERYIPGKIKQADLARTFGVTQTQISRIVANKSWRQ